MPKENKPQPQFNIDTNDFNVFLKEEMEKCIQTNEKFKSFYEKFFTVGDYYSKEFDAANNPEGKEDFEMMKKNNKLNNENYEIWMNDIIKSYEKWKDKKNRIEKDF